MRKCTFLLCILTLIAMLIPKSILWCSYGYNYQSVYTYRNYFTFTVYGIPLIFFVIPFLIYPNYRAIANRKNYTLIHWILSSFLLFIMHLLGVFLFGTQHCQEVSFIWEPFLPPILLVGSMLTSLSAFMCDFFSEKSK